MTGVMELLKLLGKVGVEKAITDFLNLSTV